MLENNANSKIEYFDISGDIEQSSLAFSKNNKCYIKNDENIKENLRAFLKMSPFNYFQDNEEQQKLQRNEEFLETLVEIAQQFQGGKVIIMKTQDATDNKERFDFYFVSGTMKSIPKNYIFNEQNINQNAVINENIACKVSLIPENVTLFSASQNQHKFVLLNTQDTIFNNLGDNVEYNNVFKLELKPMDPLMNATTLLFDEVGLIQANIKQKAEALMHAMYYSKLPEPEGNDNIYDALKSDFASGLPLITKLWQDANNWTENIKNSIADNLQNAKNLTGTFIENTTNAVKNGVEDIKNWAGDKMKNIGGNLNCMNGVTEEKKNEINFDKSNIFQEDDDHNNTQNDFNTPQENIDNNLDKMLPKFGVDTGKKNNNVGFNGETNNIKNLMPQKTVNTKLKNKLKNFDKNIDNNSESQEESGIDTDKNNIKNDDNTPQDNIDNNKDNHEDNIKLPKFGVNTGKNNNNNIDFKGKINNIEDLTGHQNNAEEKSKIEENDKLNQEDNDYNNIKNDFNTPQENIENIIEIPKMTLNLQNIDNNEGEIPQKNVEVNTGENNNKINDNEDSMEQKNNAEGEEKSKKIEENKLNQEDNGYNKSKKIDETIDKENNKSLSINEKLNGSFLEKKDKKYKKGNSIVYDKNKKINIEDFVNKIDNKNKNKEIENKNKNNEKPNEKPNDVSKKKGSQSLNNSYSFDDKLNGSSSIEDEDIKNKSMITKPTQFDNFFPKDEEEGMNNGEGTGTGEETGGEGNNTSNEEGGAGGEGNNTSNEEGGIGNGGEPTVNNEEGGEGIGEEAGGETGGEGTGEGIGEEAGGEAVGETGGEINTNTGTGFGPGGSTNTAEDGEGNTSMSIGAFVFNNIDVSDAKNNVPMKFGSSSIRGRGSNLNAAPMPKQNTTGQRIKITKKNIVEKGKKNNKPEDNEKKNDAMNQLEQVPPAPVSEKQDNKKEEEKNGLSTGQIIAIIVCGIVVPIIGGLIVWVIFTILEDNETKKGEEGKKKEPTTEKLSADKSETKNLEPAPINQTVGKKNEVGSIIKYNMNSLYNDNKRNIL